VAVRIRMKKLGRRHRPFFRICAMDSRTPRDGRAIEELGTYDPMVRETDARCKLKADRIDYWLSVGAKPSEKVAVLIRKYGTNGSHLEAQKEALQRVEAGRGRPVVPQSTQPAETTEEAPEEAPAEAETVAETPTEESAPSE
jgi:small subunit ribosomal protein S16